MPVLSVGSVHVNAAPLRSGSLDSGRSMLKKSIRWPAIDLTVALTTFPALVVLTLLLDFNLTADWANQRDSTIVVLSLVAAFVAVSLLTFGYVTYRMGFRLWAGPQAIDNESPQQRAANDGRLYYLDIAPPSYDIVMQIASDQPDMDLPTYESIVGGFGKRSDVENEDVAKVPCVMYI